MAWRDALLQLHTAGWNADDIDEACEALHEACDEGEFAGTEISDLTPHQIRYLLSVTLDLALLSSLRAIATLRHRQSLDAEELQRALYYLDAFAYEFAGDD